MLKKYTWLGVALLLVGMVAVAVPMSTYAQQGEVDGNFILVNYLGREIVLDLDDTTYTVPGTATAPEGGRFTAQLMPGDHKYAVTVPGKGGAAGEFTLSPGEVVGKSVVIEKSGPVVSREGIVLEKPQDEVRVYDFDPSAPAVEQTPVADTWQPSAPTAGQGSIVWINQGGVDELTVDLEGETHTVPPQQNGVPGRRQLDLPPGTYTYTVSVPNGSLSGKVTVEVGEVIALDVTPVREAPDYEVGEPFEALPPAQLNLSQQEITGQVSSSTQTVDQEAPADLPTTGGDVAPAAAEKAQPVTGLTVKNYAGDTLTFTISNQSYTIMPGAAQTLPVPPGEYAYTASLPFVATTGIVDLGPDEHVGLSIAINVAHDALSVYET